MENRFDTKSFLALIINRTPPPPPKKKKKTNKNKNKNKKSIQSIFTLLFLNSIKLLSNWFLVHK